MRRRMQIHQDPSLLQSGSYLNLSLKIVLEHGLLNHFPTVILCTFITLHYITFHFIFFFLAELK